MIDLSYLITIPVFLLGGIILITSNYKINYTPRESNTLKYMTLLEENHSMISYLLRKYTQNVINTTVNLFSSLKANSFWYNNSESEKEKLKNERNEYITEIIKKIGLFLSLVTFSIIIITWFKFSRMDSDYQFLVNIGPLKPIWSLNIILGLDGLSLPFVLLIGIILPIVYLSNWSTIDYNEAYYILIIVLLELFLIIVFLVIDLVMFYVFFESILPPLFVLIGLYGASQKFRAGYYLFLYTLVGSLFMLLSFLKVGGDSGSTFFEASTSGNFFQLYQELIWLILFVSFSVKTPLIPVHIWLPLAHSDANVSGSIILASIVLKLALYGFIRILINIFSSGTSKLTPFFYAICCLSVVYASSTTMRQFDLKVIVAYSSIAHMASSLLGTFSDTLSGIVGSIIFGISHGFVSPGLFILVGAVLYDRCGSRIINYYRGLSNLTPLFAIMFLILIFGNMGVPLTGNFIGEFLSLLGAYQQNIFIASIATTSVILSAVYSIYFFNRIASGSVSPHVFTIPDLFRKEYYILLPLLVLTIILGVFPSIITTDIEFAISHCLLFSISPVVFNDGDENEKDVQKLHETNCNPHNTPVVNNVLPPSSSRNLNPSINFEDNTANTSNSLQIGNPNSDEGNTPFIDLEHKKNKAVDPQELSDKIEDHLVESELKSNMNRWSWSSNKDLVENNDLVDNINQVINNKQKDIEDNNTKPNSIETIQNDLKELNISKDLNLKSDKNISDITLNSKSSENSFQLDSDIDSSSNSKPTNSNVEPDSKSDILDNDSNNMSGSNLPQKKSYVYDSDDSLSEAESTSSEESFNSRNYLEKHSGRRHRDFIEENIESQNSDVESTQEETNSQNNDVENIEEETNSQNVDIENSEDKNMSTNKGKEIKKEDYDSDEDSVWSTSSLDTVNSKNYHEYYGKNAKRNQLENLENNNENNRGENNSNNNIIENNNSSNNYTISNFDSFNNSPDGNFIYIPDYLFFISEFINNIITFDFSTITPIHLFLLFITFISYYRYYILCISIKNTFSQCFIVLKYSMNKILSFFFCK